LSIIRKYLLIDEMIQDRTIMCKSMIQLHEQVIIFQAIAAVLLRKLREVVNPPIWQIVVGV
jgi:hypothetical protein